MVSLGERLREERVRLGLSQLQLADKMKRSRKSQIRYESGDRSLDAEDLVAAAKAGVDILYVLTGVRSDPSLAPAQAEPLEPMKFMFCADLVTQEYETAGIDLPPMARKIEALWAYDEMVNRLTDPEDGDEIEAVLPQIRHMLRKRIEDHMNKD